jgi:hypothetical protein
VRRRMGMPFKALDLFPDSTMHKLLSYETMLNGVLTGSKEEDAKLDHQGVASWTPVASLCSAIIYRTIRRTQRGVTWRYCHYQTRHLRKTR